MAEHTSLFQVEFTGTHTASQFGTSTNGVRITLKQTYQDNAKTSVISLENLEFKRVDNTTNWSNKKIYGNIYIKANNTTTNLVEMDGTGYDKQGYATIRDGNYTSWDDTYVAKSTKTVTHNDNGTLDIIVGLSGGWLIDGVNYFGVLIDNAGKYDVIGVTPTEKTVALTNVGHVLTVKPNGGTWNGSTSDQTFTQAPTTTKTISNPTRTGYTFSNWSKSGGGSISGTIYTFGNSDGILTANWTPIAYTLTTVVNPSGYGTVTAGGSVNYGSTKQLTAAPTQISGYSTTFKNWSYTSGTLSSTTTNPTTFTMGNGNATVTANFERTPNNYYVKFYSNGGSGSMADQKFTVGVAQALSANTFTRSGYAFDHWNTKSDNSGTSFSDQQQVSTLAYSGTIDLYAIWNRTDYTVSYNANGHGTAPSSQTKVAGTPLTLRAFITTTDTTPGTVSNFVITGNANGGSWSGSNGSATKQPTYEYTQSAWNTKQNGSGTSFSSQGSYTLDQNNTLYAIWSQSVKTTAYTYTLPTGTPTNNETVNIIFDPNGGTTTKSSEYTHRAMTFAGWWTLPTGGTQRTSASQVSASETVYAHYDQTSGSYEHITLPTAAQCTKVGQQLLGWSYRSYATVPDYEPGEVIYPTTTDPLYAVWDKYGLVYINNEKYQIRIGNGTTWERYRAYIGNGSEWVAY